MSLQQPESPGFRKSFDPHGLNDGSEHNNNNNDCFCSFWSPPKQITNGNKNNNNSRSLMILDDKEKVPDTPSASTAASTNFASPDQNMMLTDSEEEEEEKKDTVGLYLPSLKKEPQDLEDMSEDELPPSMDDGDEDEEPAKTEVPEVIVEAVPVLAPEASKTISNGIEARINEAVQNAKIEAHASPMLVPAKQEYEKMRKSLRGMIAAAKGYNASYQNVSNNRTQVVSALSKLSHGSPLEESVSATSNPKSMASITQNLSKYTQGHAAVFETAILNYLVEWERIVARKVDLEMGHVKKLQVVRTHYEDKVDKLRGTARALESKGKAPSKRQQERLNRNELKLRSAFEAHEKAAGKAHALMTEVVQMGWKDLYPVARKYLEWEHERSGRELDILKDLPDIVKAMGSVQESV